MNWFELSSQGIVLHLKVQPRSKITKVIGIYGDPPRLKIRLAAPPVEGKANQELLSFLKKALKTTHSQLKIIRGEKVSRKDILCIGVTLDCIKNLSQDNQLKLF